MSIPGSASPLLLASTAAAAGGYQISRSLRFNSADSAYLSRTPSTASSRTTWTWAAWVKRSGLTGSTLFSTFGSDDNTLFSFEIDSDNLRLAGSLTQWVRTTAVFRDPSAWYHILLATDTTQAISSDRFKIYVNGTQITAFAATSYPGPSQALGVNDTRLHHIGAYWNTSPNFNGYLADIHFIDGQALTPSSFTEVSATTGQLIPKTYTGTFGTNGFWLKFSDNSAATAATLGKDYSGNSNNWTPNNLSVTAGAGNDSLVDTPTSIPATDTGVGGEIRGNYCVLNTAAPNKSTTSITDGGLQFLESTTQGSGDGTAVGTIGISSGKWYWEATALDITGTTGGQYANVGILKKLGTDTLSDYIGKSANSYAYYSGNGTKGNNNSFVSYGAAWATSAVIGVALDLDNGTLTFYKNNTSQGTAYTGLNTGEIYVPACSGASNGKLAFNFGQRQWAYAAPAGFKALCDTNLAEGTITTSGTFTGDASADGPFVYLNGVPTAMTINSNAVTFATHADKLSNGFKLRTSSGSYNTAGSNSYSITTTGAKFKYARAQPNP